MCSVDEEDGNFRSLTGKSHRRLPFPACPAWTCAKRKFAASSWSENEPKTVLDSNRSHICLLQSTKSDEEDEWGWGKTTTEWILPTFLAKFCQQNYFSLDQNPQQNYWPYAASSTPPESRFVCGISYSLASSQTPTDPCKPATPESSPWSTVKKNIPWMKTMHPIQQWFFFWM